MKTYTFMIGFTMHAIKHQYLPQNSITCKSVKLYQLGNEFINK